MGEAPPRVTRCTLHTCTCTSEGAALRIQGQVGGWTELLREHTLPSSLPAFWGSRGPEFLQAHSPFLGLFPLETPSKLCRWALPWGYKALLRSETPRLLGGYSCVRKGRSTRTEPGFTHSALIPLGLDFTYSCVTPTLVLNHQV